MRSVRSVGRTVGVVALLLVYSGFSSAQDSYYKIIQKTANQIDPHRFERLEQTLLREYARPDHYAELADLFDHTTEKVWSVVYGEVYCSAAPHSDDFGSIAALVFRSYDQSLSKQGTSLTVDLTEHAQASPGRLPFEEQFEQSFLFAAISLRGDVVPLTIEKLSQLRKQQLSIWQQKRMPSTELVRRQQVIFDAGHFEAYNYWLFQSARPDEFNKWRSTHEAEYQAWLDWQAKNPFVIRTPDFQRPYLIRAQ